MDKKIIAFIEAQKNLTLCTSRNNEPYCASCFYAFLEEENLLVFKSSRTSRHIEEALLNEKVAGTIVPDLARVGVIKGLQFSGRFFTPEHEVLGRLRKSYYLRFPFAAAVDGDLWAIELLNIKYTDNTFGFGKKILWEKDPALLRGT